jgi:cytochrome c oxidase subunit 2
MYITPQVIGTYKGKCAELCGEFHSMMLFNVKVVSQEDYDARMDELAKMGNVGQLTANPDDPDNINRNNNLPGNKPKSEG